jgi:ABC-type phosphate transport system substrate-binding protein
MALPFAWAGSASADYQPQPGDIVGVGGDTPQFAVDFALNGYPGGTPGFNSAATVNRVISFDATADSNGRAAYANGSSEASPKPLNPTDVLRAGTFPQQRVQSSGTAIKALLADWKQTPTNHTEQTPTFTNQINFVASASLPTAAQENQAVNQGWGGLHDVEIATDNIEVAADTTSNAPAALTTAQLVSIYSAPSPGITWSALTGGVDSSTDYVIPELPPAGSSVYKTFVKALNHSYNGSTGQTTFAFSESPNVVTVEQNAPTAITGAANPADAIAPFAAGRLTLWNAGYFHNPATLGYGGTVLTPGIKLLTGTPDGGGSYYKSAITDYVIFRQSDLSDSTPIEPGGTLNWAKALFSDSGGPTPFFATPIGQSLLAEAGVTPTYNDLGLA